jgi:hypothetical protein
VNIEDRMNSLLCKASIILLNIGLIQMTNTQTKTFKASVADPGCLSRIPDPDFYPSRIPDPKTATKERGEKN